MIKINSNWTSLTWDETKRQANLEKRNVDFADAELVFRGEVFAFEDKRQDYGEQRIISIGFLHGRMMMIAWTPRGETRRIISMRKTNERETEKYNEFIERKKQLRK